VIVVSNILDELTTDAGFRMSDALRSRAPGSG
jgi:hypothetical protein